MSWYIPATGELIRGKPDGQSRPITGPQQPEGATFVWRQTSADRIEFYASINGRLVETAVETLSSDGRTFSDALWKSGHQDEKDQGVPQRVSSVEGGGSAELYKSTFLPEYRSSVSEIWSSDG